MNHCTVSGKLRNECCGIIGSSYRFKVMLSTNLSRLRHIYIFISPIFQSKVSINSVFETQSLSWIQEGKEILNLSSKHFYLSTHFHSVKIIYVKRFLAQKSHIKCCCMVIFLERRLKIFYGTSIVRQRLVNVVSI